MKINFKPDPKPAPKSKKKKYSIAKISPKRKNENEIYKVESKEFIKGKKCYIEGCNKIAQGVDHIKGRWGKLFLDKNYWRPCCNFHNQELENNTKLKKIYHLSKIHGGKLK